MSAKLIVLALCLASTQALYVKLGAPDVEYCMDGSDAWFGNIVADITPWPVHVAAGETINIKANGDILQEIEVGSKLALKMTLKTAIGNLPIPCLPIEDLQIGSCEYEVQKLLDDLTELTGGDCSTFFPDGQGCSLPLMAGSYGTGDQSMPIDLPDIPPVLEPFLKGKIEVEATGSKADGTKVACLKLTLELQ